MHIRKVTLIFLCFISMIISFVIADMESNKRIMPDGSSHHAFHQMVRYGRSSNKNAKIQVYPRGDAFYLGPRYGKRSKFNLNSDEEETFPCKYTGVTNLYRCNTSESKILQENRI